MGSSRTPGGSASTLADPEATLSRSIAYLGPSDGGDDLYWETITEALAAIRAVPSGTTVDLAWITEPVRAAMQYGYAPLSTSPAVQELYSEVVVRIAENYLYVREAKVRGKSRNTGEEVEIFQERAGGKAGEAWCASFAYYCHSEAAALLGGFTTAPRTRAASFMWYDSKGVNDRYTVADVRSGSVKPLPGDVFVFEQLIATPKSIKKAYEKALKDAEALKRQPKNDEADHAATTPGERLRAGTTAGNANAAYDAAVKAAESTRDALTRALRQGAVTGDHLAKDDRKFFPSHAGIVKAYEPAVPRLTTIEGNTSDGEVGSREGDGVFLRTDRMDVHFKTRWPKYPQLYGFVRPRFTYS